MCSPTVWVLSDTWSDQLYKAERFNQYDPKYVTELVFIDVQAGGCFLIDLYRTCDLWYHPLMAIRKSAGLRHLCVCFTFQTKKPRPPFIPCMVSAQSLHHSVRATHWSGAPVALCHAHNVPHSPHVTHLTHTPSSRLNSKCSHLLSHVRAAALHRHVLAWHLHHIFLEAPGVFLVDFYDSHICKERKELRVQTGLLLFWLKVSIHTRQQKAHTAGALNQLWKNKSNFYWSSSIVYDIKPNRATDTTQWSHRTMAATPRSYIRTLQAEVTGHMSKPGMCYFLFPFTYSGIHLLLTTDYLTEGCCLTDI